MPLGNATAVVHGLRRGRDGPLERQHRRRGQADTTRVGGHRRIRGCLESLLGGTARHGRCQAASRWLKLTMTPCGPVFREDQELCGTDEVFEDRAAKSGRKISLNVHLLRAVAPEPLPDAVFALAGGPTSPMAPCKSCAPAATLCSSISAARANRIRCGATICIPRPKRSSTICRCSTNWRPARLGIRQRRYQRRRALAIGARRTDPWYVRKACCTSTNTNAPC
jgi:hypothetical protein